MEHHRRGPNKPRRPDGGVGRTRSSPRRRELPHDRSGYKILLGWLSDFGPVELVGVEGTGSDGAGPTRHLQAEQVRVVEVDRPNRQRRRRKGKSDPQDVITAARAALSGDAAGEAKTKDGNVEAMRVLRVARASARKGRTQALNRCAAQPPPRPSPPGPSSGASTCSASSSGPRPIGPGQARHRLLTKHTLRMLARRAITLEEEVTEIDAILKPLVKETAPELVDALGVGTDAASALFVTAGDNPERFHDEAAFADLSAPHQSSQQRKRNATGSTAAVIVRPTRPWHIVITRMVYDPRTSEYIERRTKEGLTKKEAVRRLKRYVAREVFSLRPHQKLGLDSP